MIHSPEALPTAYFVSLNYNFQMALWPGSHIVPPKKRHWEPAHFVSVRYTRPNLLFLISFYFRGEPVNSATSLYWLDYSVIPKILMYPEDLGLEEPGPVIVICTETEKAGNSILLGYMNEVCFGFNPENKALQLSAGDSIFGLNYRILCVHNLVSEIVQIFQAGILKCY